MAVQQDIIRSVERVFWIALFASFLLHFISSIVVTTVDLPPPATQGDYANWVRKVATAPEASVVIPEEVKVAKEVARQPQVEEGVASGAGTGAATQGAR